MLRNQKMITAPSSYSQAKMSNSQHNTFVPTLTHSVNSSGRMGFYVDPYSCSCSGCHDHIAEPRGLSNLAPPTALNLERQTGMGSGSPDRTPPFTGLSPSASDLSPIPMNHYLPQRSNGGGIPYPSLAPTPTGLGNWRELVSRFSAQTEDEAPPAPSSSPEVEKHSGLCACPPCCGEDEITGLSLDLKEEIMEQLYSYLAILEKQRKMIDAKMDFYSFLFEDASLRLRTQQLSLKILKLKNLINKMEGNENEHE